MAIFNKQSAREMSALPTTPGSATGKRGLFSVIGPDMLITGNVSASADLHVDGRIEGDVQCATLVQGTNSHISGAVRAESARLAGAVEGSVSVRQLTVERAARIMGDVEYDIIAIETGASINGRLTHGTADQADANAPLTAVQTDDVVHFTTAPTQA